MTPKSKLIASAATTLVLASMASFTVHAQATRPVAGGTIKVGSEAALRTSRSGHSPSWDPKRIGLMDMPTYEIDEQPVECAGHQSR